MQRIGFVVDPGLQPHETLPGRAAAFHLELGGQIGAQQFFGRRRAARTRLEFVQQFVPAISDLGTASLEHGLEQAFLRSEIVRNQRRVHAGLLGYLAQRRGFVTTVGKNHFGRVENLLAFAGLIIQFTLWTAGSTTGQPALHRSIPCSGEST